MPEIRQHATDLLRLIQESLPMEGEAALQWDESNQCSLTFDEDIAVIITLDEVVDAIFLNWILGALPLEPDEVANALQELLEANHEWNKTEGGTLGLDADTGLVTLSYRVDLPLDDAAVIQDIIAKLYNVSSHWQKSLNLGYPSAEVLSARSVRDSL
ncbi:type III secretion system chaperone [Roseimicrobium sp. ORNL1]|uniref:type III secretion system chaperone n=1 Tax=Roseimicrobium sp. ORNL1 TaxID=2711231 RepID=UPI0013E19C94|nr:type III secretion system chaperone [Roseimicrobium sp. ORNL1]QIF05849.1 type III secretion system chaperone [Roseimicrobium sp. ORNL1]